MRRSSILPLFALALLLRPAEACELVDTATAEQVLGVEVTDLTADPATLCMFIAPATAAQFLVQTDPGDYYDKVTIPEPHEPADVGEKARSHAFPNGGAALQFVTGDLSITLGVRLPGGRDGRDYLSLLISVAEEIVEEMD